VVLQFFFLLSFLAPADPNVIVGGTVQTVLAIDSAADRNGMIAVSDEIVLTQKKS
jgi:hypothetical protein